MHLTLLRHAERENTGVSNPPLNARGLKQAEKLIQLVEAHQIPRPQRLFCSPKLRATMTLQKLHENLKLELVVSKELDERVNSETADQFSKRVKSFLAQSAGRNENLIFCTHLDWIEEALIHIPSDADLLQDKYQNWGTGSYMTFAVSQDLWYLEKWGRIEV
jgi:broad specificity phosphatase PhoE